MSEAEKPKFDFWNDHSVEFLEMAMRRDYQETVTGCDGTGTAQRDCGDTVTFYLMADQGRLTAVSYDIKGCLFSHACANTIIELAREKSVEQAAAIKASDIIDYLKTLPENEAHCATLALKAFNLALSDLT